MKVIKFPKENLYFRDDKFIFQDVPENPAASQIYKMLKDTELGNRVEISLEEYVEVLERALLDKRYREIYYDVRPTPGIKAPKMASTTQP